MNMRRLLVLALILGMLLVIPGAAAGALERAPAAPLAGPCVAGATYNAACDVNQDNAINILDIQLAAGHWNQTGAFTSDNNHTHLGQTWTGASNPLKIQGAFGSPDYAPLVLSNSAGHGLSILTASIDGIYVGNAGAYGMVVNAATQDGVYVGTAGTPSFSTASPASNGFEVAGAQGDGLYVGRADNVGVVVNSANIDGVMVNSTGAHGVLVNSAGFDGLFVNTAVQHGVEVGSAGNTGVYVYSAGNTGVFANTTQASGQWGFYTPDRIFGTLGMFSALSLVAQVSGPDGLAPGDLVAVAGRADPLPGSTVHVPLVRLADGAGSVVVGVVESRLALTQQPSPAQPTEGAARTEAPTSELRNADGPAQAGDYVAIVVLGVTQAKVTTAAIAITAGTRLTAAANGMVRPLQTRTVDGMIVTEGAPVVGVALEPAKDGTVWVLVNLQ